MSARITQRTQQDQQRWSVGVQLKRGTTPVGDEAQVFMPVRDSIAHLAWSFVLPSTFPATGDWSFLVPILSEFDAQDVGVVLAGGVLGAAWMDTGVIYTNAPISGSAGQRVTLRGMVEV